MAGKLLFGALADDLTGGVELAGMLAAGGAATQLVTDAAAVDEVRGADAIVIARRTRVIPAADAVAAFREGGEALKAHGARQIFYKYCATFDSTPAGNIGPCADVLREITGADGTLFCPSFPEPERTVYQGHLFVGSALVSNSPKRLDPLTPMTEPDLVKVLQAQTATKVGLVALPTVLAGAEAVRAAARALFAAGTAYAIVDTVSESDLVTIAEATWDWPLMTGGSSVAAYYPGLWQRHGLLQAKVPAPLPGMDGPGVVLAGSCAAQTQAQMAAFAEYHPVLGIDLTASENVEASVARALDWAERQASAAVGFTTAETAESVAAAQSALGRDGAARRAEQILAALAKQLVERGTRRLVVAGGETSGAVVEALGIRRMTVAPFTRPGIGLCVTDAPEPLALCLKSGKLGSRDMFAEALATMGRAHA
ncbi:3-oxo-tetronate kinase [Rhodoligotrophos defluvii]|uniref:3-oxo-tetronate kinase n=1 Tax=Rhodoligotrophos defluvii TaxID=2561934 RepID=UPI001EEFEB5D|nr:3-oxo-tetronate kinase [Rhodoligotrophos defluvii]